MDDKLNILSFNGFGKFEMSHKERCKAKEGGWQLVKGQNINTKDKLLSKLYIIT